MFEALTKPTPRTITPKQAAELLADNDYEFQRPLRARRVAQLVNSMREGTFRHGDIALATNCETDKRYIMNGQHTLTAATIYGKPIQTVVTEYKCYTPEDFALLFRQFDNGGGRSQGNFVISEAGALGIDWDARICSIVVSAAVILRGATESTADKKVELLKDFIREGEFVNKILTEGGDSSHLRRKAVVAVMIQTWQKNKTAANDFWSRVRDGENIKARSPENHLRTFLLSHRPMKGQQGNTPNRMMVTDHEIMYRCSLAWNAFRRGQEIHALKYFQSCDVPKVIA